jgi:hypothetical protein
MRIGPAMMGVGLVMAACAPQPSGPYGASYFGGPAYYGGPGLRM